MTAAPPPYDKRRIRRAFSRYTAADSPAHIPAQRLAERLGDMALSPQQIIDIGGDGAFIHARYPQARVAAVDGALPVLRGGATDSPNHWRLLGDAEQLPLADAVADLLWSNLCLEWTDARLFVGEAARVLKTDGLLALSTLGTGTLPEMRRVFDGEGRVHTFADMHDIGDLLMANGFAEPIVESDRITLTYADADAALRDMRNLGGGCALSQRPRGCMGRQRWRRAVADYAAQNADADGRVPATFELVYLTAWRRAAATAETPVHFHR